MRSFVLPISSVKTAGLVRAVSIFAPVLFRKFYGFATGLILVQFSKYVQIFCTPCMHRMGFFVTSVCEEPKLSNQKVNSRNCSLTFLPIAYGTASEMLNVSLRVPCKATECLKQSWQLGGPTPSFLG